MTPEPTPPYLTSLLAEPAAALAAGSASFVSAAPHDPLAGTLREVAVNFPAELLDPDAVRVIDKLTSAGHEAYLVGGCVRDLLFGLKPKDFDIATSALPNDVRRCFRNCRIIGRRFRLAHVFFRDKILEVATFRANMPPQAADITEGPATEAPEGESKELLIRDDNVFGSREEDVLRRDFTVNALLYDTARGVILDYTGGVDDARERVIRTIGDPDIRCQEDPIRMLRAIRLAARLGCRIDRDTWAAIIRHRGRIKDAARPRVLEDVQRMFRGGAMAPAFDLMIESGVLEVVLPELHEHLRGEARRGDFEEVEAMRAVLRAADRAAHAGRELTLAQKLAVLLAPTVLTPDRDAPVTGRPTTSAERASERMRPIALRLALSRKDGERLRQVLLALPRLVPRGSSRRRGAAALAGRSYFAEALDVFELFSNATGDFRDEVQNWRSRVSHATPRDAAPSASAPERTAPSGSRRRRRRPRRSPREAN